jgi:hypothetical protein
MLYVSEFMKSITQLLFLEACFMTGVRYLVVILIMVMTSACSDTQQGQSAKSLPDNPENRIVVAKRYLEVMPPKEMLQGLANRVVSKLPENDRKTFMDVMSSQEIEKTAYRFTLDGLVKHFTVDELNAMVAFYGSPAGQAAYKKFSPYMGEIMPQIQQEVKKALEEVQKQQGPKVQPMPKAQPAPAPPKEQKEPQTKQ